MFGKISFCISSIFGFLFNLILAYKLKDFVPKKTKEYLPKEHHRKVSNFGGIAFIISLLVALLISYSYLDKNLIYIFLFSLIPFAFIGFLDDYKKLFDPEGLKEKHKLILQVIFSLILGGVILLKKKYHILDLVFFKINLSGLSFLVYYLIFSIIFLNAFNFIDGIDGLAASLAIILFLLLFAFTGKYEYLVVISVLLSFLFFNFPPAKIFMGDTGSLAIGALLLASFVYFSLEKVLLISGFIIFFEFLSVVLQRYYFKFTRKIFGEGRRIFKMAPFHHHLEKCEIPQTKILGSFVVLTAFFSLISYLIFY
ncbi:MAG TPA: hypothetical protein EYH39_01115 [Desulfurobacteriaceae bacterium]|nr:hypothetical protein [Desulfurobacteriaceae bacterium]